MRNERILLIVEVVGRNMSSEYKQTKTQKHLVNTNIETQYHTIVW